MMSQQGIVRTNGPPPTKALARVFGLNAQQWTQLPIHQLNQYVGDSLASAHDPILFEKTQLYALLKSISHFEIRLWYADFYEDCDHTQAPSELLEKVREHLLMSASMGGEIYIHHRPVGITDL